MNLFQKAMDLELSNTSFAMITLLESKGSTPRNQARMIVDQHGKTYGTIGGGPAEAATIEDALIAIQNGDSTEKTYTLNKEQEGGLNMQCGGNMRIFIDVILGKQQLILIGGGHVNLEVAWMADRLGYNVVVVDDRPGYTTPERFPMASNLYVAETMKEAIEACPLADDVAVVIATKDDDLTGLREVLKKTDGKYVGVIGSKRKIHKINQQLLEEQVAKERLEAVYGPIGLNIGAETPAEIALSILSELTAVLGHQDGKSMREGRHAI